MPAKKKDPSLRARRNKTSTRATLRRVTEDTTTAEEFEAMTLAQLREAIDLKNQSRPADQQLPKRKPKAELVALLVAAERAIPEMPAHPPRYDDEGYQLDVDWHAQTVAWWNDAWTSPMAAEWDDSDFHNMTILALLYNDIWVADSPRSRKEALGEFRLQRADLGLSPYSRRRLEWAFETADEAKERGQQRRNKSRGGPGPTPAPTPKNDPRLTLVSGQ